MREARLERARAKRFANRDAINGKRREKYRVARCQATQSAYVLGVNWTPPATPPAPSIPALSHQGA